MKVFKFGGASINSIERIQNVKKILQTYAHDKILVIISAMGKTTNALEEVVQAFYHNEQEKALELFAAIKQNHLQVAEQLMAEFNEPSSHQPVSQLTDLLTEVEWLLHDKPVRNFDYYYDQIVCIGELLSSCIVGQYFNAAGLSNKWIDVRDVLRTDNNFRDARIEWEVTNSRIQNVAVPLFADYNLVITQGFIGATADNETTTLGREGSDFTAAIFANLLPAKSLTIWKDVPGVMNADPKLYDKAEWIRELNFQEVIEMAYYGAQVIHPKTIKPLQNKNIPLYVKSFLEPAAEGTYIHPTQINHLPPIIVFKQNQVLLQLVSKDFSFVGEGLTLEVNKFFQQLKFRPNLTQLAAISLLLVTDDKGEKTEQFRQAVSELFDVNVTPNLTLLTIRHYENKLVEELTEGKKILLRQQTPDTIQLLLLAAGR